MGERTQGYNPFGEGWGGSGITVRREEESGVKVTE